MLFDLPKEQSSIIKVIGIGGGGCNAVNHMFRQGINDVNFVICNTDAQALEASPVPNRIQLGPELTKGRGAGAHPEKGQAATLESVKEVKELMERNTEMVFITAGMGGGTGTGGAPVIARIAREMGILTVAIVTLPFSFEGKKRIAQAHKGIAELKDQVDSIIVIVNDKIREVFGDLVFSEAFARADDVLTTAAKGIAEIITIPGYVNVDFEDVKTVLRDSGVAIMGIGKAGGDNRAIDAVEAALSSPLLNDTNIHGARHVLLNITSGRKEVRMDEISEITEYVQEAAGTDSDIIWGNCMDESLDDELSVTVIATGFESPDRILGMSPGSAERKVLPLEQQQVPAPVAKAEAPKTNDPHIRTAESTPGRAIDPFNRLQQHAETEVNSEVLPFAYSLDREETNEPEARIQPAPSAYPDDTVGKPARFIPLNHPSEEQEFVDPAQVSMFDDMPVSKAKPAPSSASEDHQSEMLDVVYREEDVLSSRGIQTPVGSDDDDMEWSDDEEDDDEWSEDEEIEEDDIDLEDRKDGNSLVWTIKSPDSKEVTAQNSSPKDSDASSRVPKEMSAQQEEAKLAAAQSGQQTPTAANQEKAKDDRVLPQPKPGLRLSKTVYPDGELATPPMLPPAPPTPAKPPVPVEAQHTPANNSDALNEAERQDFIRRAEERRRRLRSMSIRPNSSIEELESTPAYLRRNVHLNDVPHSSEQTISKLHLGDADEGLVPKPNSYLFNNVD